MVLVLDSAAGEIAEKVGKGEEEYGGCGGRRRG